MVVFVQISSHSFALQVYFNEEKGVVAAKELNADVTRTLSCILRSSDATDRVGKWMKKQVPFPC